jgi:DNA-binding response OmpR family regulator
VTADNDDTLRGLKVLVVEDEYFLASDLQQALEAAGAIVLGPCPSFARAAGRMSDPSIACAIMDINLRGEMSTDLCLELADRGVCVLLVSGYDPASLPEALASLPSVQKPVGPAALVDRLKDAVRQSQRLENAEGPRRSDR